tara:strand:- start:6254 stop:6934 length:681 start_codon:yes stop_codon:yes gene_type:complete
LIIKIKNSITLISFIISLICILLCFWQIKRLSWKNNLIQNIENAYNSESININKFSGNLKKFEFKKINAEGFFLEDKNMFLGPRIYKSQVGYNLISPFFTKDNRYILINRGWTKEKKKFKQNNKIFFIEGIIKKDNLKNIFTPNNSLKKNSWFYINTSEMSEFTNLNLVDGIFIELINIKPNIENILINRSVPEITNNHLQYAITWMLLSILFLIMNYIYLRKKDE